MTTCLDLKMFCNFKHWTPTSRYYFPIFCHSNVIFVNLSFLYAIHNSFLCFFVFGIGMKTRLFIRDMGISHGNDTDHLLINDRNAFNFQFLLVLCALLDNPMYRYLSMVRVQ
jgi:hypothetical protein